jgi:hypothetical protein
MTFYLYIYYICNFIESMLMIRCQIFDTLSVI